MGLSVLSCCLCLAVCVLLFVSFSSFHHFFILVIVVVVVVIVVVVGDEVRLYGSFCFVLFVYLLVGWSVGELDGLGVMGK